MTKNYENKVRKSLQEAIEKWWLDNNWDMETYISDDTFKYMAESAFNILMAQKSLTNYCHDNNNGQV